MGSIQLFRRSRFQCAAAAASFAPGADTAVDTPLGPARKCHMPSDERKHSLGECLPKRPEIRDRDRGVRPAEQSQVARRSPVSTAHRHNHKTARHRDPCRRAVCLACGEIRSAGYRSSSSSRNGPSTTAVVRFRGPGGVVDIPSHRDGGLETRGQRADPGIERICPGHSAWRDCRRQSVPACLFMPRGARGDGPAALCIVDSFSYSHGRYCLAFSEKGLGSRETLNAMRFKLLLGLWQGERI